MTPPQAARAIGAANTLSFARRADRRREHRRDRASWTRCRIRRPARARWCSARAARRAPWSGRWSTQAPRSRSGTAPPRRPSAWRAELGASALATGDERSTSADFDLLVNATTVGMGSARPRRRRTSRACPSMPMRSARHTNWWTSPTGRPRRSSSSAARARRATVVDGLEVLVRQGAASLRIWTGQDPPIETMRRAARGHMAIVNRRGHLRPVPSRARRRPASSRTTAARPRATGSPRRCSAATRGCSSRT